MSKPGISLIISFYNKLNYLKLVLAGLEIQSYKLFEVIIADDGSNETIVKELQYIIKNSHLDITHIWHKNIGWRKNEILNKAIKASKSDYLIFIDGDCIPHSKFIEEHFKNHAVNTVIAGRRVNLSPRVSELLTSEKIKKGFLEGRLFWLLLFDSIKGKARDVENGIYIKSKIIRKLINKKDKGILGSHFSLYKSDILTVNGFDERYQAPAAGEDTDIEFRLRLAGINVKTLKHIAIQYHMFHKKLTRSEKNIEILRKVKSKRIFYTPYGIYKS